MDEALTLVSEQRRKEAMRYRQEHDRRLSLAVYMLLCEALRTEYGVTTKPEFVFGHHGKPLLADRPDIHFNLSHCRRAALCVTSNEPVGCDVEMFPDELDMDVCRYCFNEIEIESILNADNPPVAFTELWTKKEAYLKLTGEGLVDNLPALLSSADAQKVCFDTYVAPDNSFVYTVCRYKKSPRHLKRAGGEGRP